MMPSTFERYLMGLGATSPDEVDLSDPRLQDRINRDYVALLESWRKHRSEISKTFSAEKRAYLKAQTDLADTFADVQTRLAETRGKDQRTVLQEYRKAQADILNAEARLATARDADNAGVFGAMQQAYLAAPAGRGATAAWEALNGYFEKGMPLNSQQLAGVLRQFGEKYVDFLDVNKWDAGDIEGALPPDLQGSIRVVAADKLDTAAGATEIQNVLQRDIDRAKGSLQTVLGSLSSGNLSPQELDAAIAQADAAISALTGNIVQAGGADPISAREQLRQFEYTDELTDEYRKALGAFQDTTTGQNGALKRAIANPAFQQWAADHGYSIGIVTEGPEGQVYIPGKSDDRAFIAFHREFTQGAGEYGVKGGDTGEVVAIDLPAGAGANNDAFRWADGQFHTQIDPTTGLKTLVAEKDAARLQGEWSVLQDPEDGEYALVRQQGETLEMVRLGAEPPDPATLDRVRRDRNLKGTVVPLSALTPEQRAPIDAVLPKWETAPDLPAGEPVRILGRRAKMNARLMFDHPGGIPYTDPNGDLQIAPAGSTVTTLADTDEDTFHLPGRPLDALRAERAVRAGDRATRTAEEALADPSVVDDATVTRRIADTTLQRAPEGLSDAAARRAQIEEAGGGESPEKRLAVLKGALDAATAAFEEAQLSGEGLSAARDALRSARQALDAEKRRARRSGAAPLAAAIEKVPDAPPLPDEAAPIPDAAPLAREERGTLRTPTPVSPADVASRTAQGIAPAREAIEAKADAANVSSRTGGGTTTVLPAGEGRGPAATGQARTPTGDDFTTAPTWRLYEWPDGDASLVRVENDTLYSIDLGNQHPAPEAIADVARTRAAEVRSAPVADLPREHREVLKGMGLLSAPSAPPAPAAKPPPPEAAPPKPAPAMKPPAAPADKPTLPEASVTKATAEKPAQYTPPMGTTGTRPGLPTQGGKERVAAPDTTPAATREAASPLGISPTGDWKPTPPPPAAVPEEEEVRPLVKWLRQVSGREKKSAAAEAKE